MSEHNSKRDYSLLDPEFMRAMADALTLGKEQHAYDWHDTETELHRDSASRAVGHIMSYKQGRAESGRPPEYHLVHAAVNAMIAFFHARRQRSHSAEARNAAYNHIANRNGRKHTASAA